MGWNSSELRAGVDRWPETQAIVTDIDQPYNDGEHDYLSVVTYTFKDATGEYWEGKYETRTSELPSDLMQGSPIKIRYDPENPRKSWSEDDYWRSGFGRFRSFDYPVTIVTLFALCLFFILVTTLFQIHAHR